MTTASGVQAGVDVESFEALDQQTLSLDCGTSSDFIVLTWPSLRTKAITSVRLFNAGAALLFFRITNDESAVALVPNGETQGDIALPAGAIEVFPVRVADDGTAVLAGITAASTATLYISPGYGS